MEYWDIYDKNKKPTGRRMKRNDWILQDGEYHLSVLGVVRRPDGKFLITKRKMNKAWAPGWWEVSGGGAQAGETSREAVIREVREETGLDVSKCPGGFAFDYHRENPGEGDNYFVDVYLFCADFREKDIRLQEAEADDFKIASLEEIRGLAEQGIFLHYDSIKKIFDDDTFRKIMTEYYSSPEDHGSPEDHSSPEDREGKDTARPELSERLRRQFDFLLEIDREKFITRRTYLSDGKRLEDDAEHAWHSAVMAYILSEYSNEKIDVLRTVMMILIHDLVEIYAGDTYAYDESGKMSQRERELAAADRLYSMLPDDQAAEMRGLWDEFEARQTPEARFARVMDNIQPLMLNIASGGRSWKEHGVHLSQPLKRNEGTAEGSRILWDYALEHYIKAGVENGWLADDRE